MTVYVDDIFTATPRTAQAKRHGCEWCHLFTDSKNLEELHAIAQKIGLKREYFQDKPRFGHYDLTPSKREKALKAGAVYKPLREFLKEQKAK